MKRNHTLHQEGKPCGVRDTKGKRILHFLLQERYVKNQSDSKINQADHDQSEILEINQIYSRLQNIFKIVEQMN